VAGSEEELGVGIGGGKPLFLTCSRLDYQKEFSNRSKVAGASPSSWLCPKVVLCTLRVFSAISAPLRSSAFNYLLRLTFNAEAQRSQRRLQTTSNGTFPDFSGKAFLAKAGETAARNTKVRISILVDLDVLEWAPTFHSEKLILLKQLPGALRASVVFSAPF
jgi:hypothetical protein